MNRKCNCADCGADLEFDTRFILNSNIYCRDCADEAANEDWQDLTVEEKVDCLGGEVDHY